MNKLITAMIVCAGCAWGCSKGQNTPNTTPPPGETHAMAEEPAPAPIAEPVAEPAPAPTETPAETDETQPVGGKSEMVTDANILAALIAGNEHEVKVGELISSRSKSADAKRYAKMLVKDHGAALKKIDGVKAKMAIDPMENETVRMMKDQSSQKIARLQGLTGKELDRAFFEMAVEDHQKTLENLDTFLPSTQNPDLKTLMTAMRPTVEHHLADAQKLLDKTTMK